MKTVAFLWAFLGGLLSFLSPCILPVAPGWLGVISGSSLEELKEGGARRRRVLAATLAFIAGFSLVFIALGLASSFLGEALAAHRVLIARILGVIVIIFGLHQGGWLRLPFLYASAACIGSDRSASGAPSSRASPSPSAGRPASGPSSPPYSR